MPPSVPHVSIALLALAACSGESGEPPAKREFASAIPEPKIAMPAAAPRPAPALAAPAPGQDGAEAAAETLRTYYRLIEAGRYEAAWQLRERPAKRGDASAFARAFSDFAQYRATIGAPSPVVESGGSLYVEVPVQTYGVTRQGKPFSSAGTVTLRRSDRQGEWRIYGG
jgi:hypothetical protein